MDKEIRELIASGEGYHLEFKEALDKSIVEEACAFANSGGGIILVGIRDDGTIKGIETDNRNRSILQDYLRVIQPNLPITIEAIDSIFLIRIPQGTEKPYACPKGFYIRNGANSQKLTRNEIIEFFQKEGRYRFDELLCEKADFNRDFDQKGFESYIQAAGISSSIDQKMLLRNLDCLNNAGHLTNLGALFFAQDIDFLINHAVVVCVLFKGNERVHILDKKDFKGNIVDNINQAVLFVQRHTNVEYVIEKLRRDEIPDIPEVALREAVVNAVCHRDYFDKRANVLIEVFDDRVIISNPGGLPNGLKPSEFGKKSVARNPLIASLLQRIHLIEKVGTGISRIREAVKENGRSEVEFTYDDFFTVTFKRSIEPDGTLNGTLSGTLNGTLKTGLKEIFECILARPGINANNLSEDLKRPLDTVKKQIKRLVDMQMIERIGSKKSGGYQVKG